MRDVVLGGDGARDAPGPAARRSRRRRGPELPVLGRPALRRSGRRRVLRRLRVRVGGIGDAPGLGAAASGRQECDGFADIDQRGETSRKQPVQQYDGVVLLPSADEGDGGVEPRRARPPTRAFQKQLPLPPPDDDAVTGMPAPPGGRTPTSTRIGGGGDVRNPHSSAALSPGEPRTGREPGDTHGIEQEPVHHRQRGIGVDLLAQPPPGGAAQLLAGEQTPGHHVGPLGTPIPARTSS